MTDTPARTHAGYRKAGTITLADRFWCNVGDRSDCWMWTGGIGNHGYGRLSHDGQYLLAHRVAYELLVGPIPDGLTIDHLCNNRPCVNPAHMEPVTRGENARRGEKNRKTRSGGAWWWSGRTECKNGHPFVEGSYRLEGNTRRCLQCQSDRVARFKARRAAR